MGTIHHKSEHLPWTGSIISGDQRRSKARFPIKKLSSNSVPIMIGNEKVYDQLEPKIKQILYKNIEAQIKFLVG